MRIPENLIIPDAKITRYLLEPKPALKLAIQTQEISTEAAEEKM